MPLLQETAWAAPILTSNSLGTAQFSANPYASTVPTTDLTLAESGSFSRNLANGGGGRTRITTAAASSGWLQYSVGTPFKVGTLMVADYCWSGWGGTYTYDVVLNSTTVRTNETGVSDLKRMFLQEMPQAISGVATTRFAFTQLQTTSPRSGTIYEAWLLPEVLRRIPLVAANVTAYGDNTYGAKGDLFDWGLLNEYLVHANNSGVFRAMEFDLGATRQVKAIFICNSWRSNIPTFRYYDGIWHDAVGLSFGGEDADVILFSTPLAATKIRLEYPWASGDDGWAGPREFIAFEEAPSSLKLGTVVVVR